MVRDTHGFTLVEMMITIALLSVVLGGLLGVVISVQKDYVRQRDVNRSQEALRAAENAITTILRSARADPFETGNALIDPNPLGNPEWDNLRVVSDYNPADGDFADPLEDVTFQRSNGTELSVRWQAGGSRQILAHPVKKLRFRYYDATGAEITNASQVNDEAVRVKIEIAADKGVRSSAVDEIESWVYLRN